MWQEYMRCRCSTQNRVLKADGFRGVVLGYGFLFVPCLCFFGAHGVYVSRVEHLGLVI